MSLQARLTGKMVGSLSERSGPRSTVIHLPAQEVSEADRADLSRSSGHHSILVIIDGSAALSMHSLPPSWNFPWFSIDRLPEPSHTSGPLLPNLLGLLVLHYGAFMLWNSSRLGPNPTVLLTLYSLALPLHYQCFQTFYWLMIRKFESPAQTSPWSSRLTNPTASFPSLLWYF